MLAFYGTIIYVAMWGKTDHLYYLTEFASLKKKNGESTSEFNKIYHNIYNKIPQDIKPSQETAKDTYARV